ncbi:MAG: MoxR family ATPase [Armatimonadetes bacterium]|nr:MoxR family ATPase [Armatimonadota bacterium]
MQAAAEEIGRVMVGKEDVIRLVLSALLARGHVLIEDVPGVGKTTLAKAVARTVGCSFSRVQFTPDLLPSDITGVSIYNQKTGEFRFQPGPVFANVVLADEINRATPKTQSALLECMEELQVTVDGATRPLPQPFLVIATENNVEQGSTYPLPEAQLDRFLVRVSIGYPSRRDEVAILDAQLREHPLHNVSGVMLSDELALFQQEIMNIHLDDALKGYIVDIVTATRGRPDIALGASPRGSLAIMRIVRARAAISGRDYVLPDDIKAVAAPVLAHRIMLGHDNWQPDAAQHIIRDIVAAVPVPVKYG